MAFVPPDTIYKIADRPLWEQAGVAGVFRGAPIDLEDGCIHFSTREQMEETAARHFAGQDDLLLVAVSTAACGEALRWEPSRGGALFPHLYAELDMAAVIWVKPLPLAADGRHIFPEADR